MLCVMRVTAAACTAAIAAACLQGCYSCEIKGRNESADALRSVAVDPAVRVPGDADAEHGTVVRQSYTIADGYFTFNRSVEKPVGTLGATFAPLSKADAERLGLEPFSGVLVRTVRKAGPAEKAGLQPGDVIVAWGGKGVMSVERLELLIEEGVPGSDGALTFQRGGARIDAAITLGTEKRVVGGKGLQQKLEIVDAVAHTGLRLAALTPEAHTVVLGANAAPGGLLVIDVLPGGPGFCADLRVRDHVTKIGGQPVASVAEYAKAIDAAWQDGEAMFTVRRGGRELEVPVEVVEDAGARGDFNVFDLIKYEGRPEGTHFCLLYHLLFKTYTNHSVRRVDGSTRNETGSQWGAVLSLIHWKSTTGGRKELRLGWFFPISWGGESKEEEGGVRVSASCNVNGQ